MKATLADTHTHTKPFKGGKNKWRDQSWLHANNFHSSSLSQVGPNHNVLKPETRQINRKMDEDRNVSSRAKEIERDAKSGLDTCSLICRIECISWMEKSVWFVCMRATNNQNWFLAAMAIKLIKWESLRHKPNAVLFVTLLWSCAYCHKAWRKRRYGEKRRKIINVSQMRATREKNIFQPWDEARNWIKASGKMTALWLHNCMANDKKQKAKLIFGH